MNLVGIINENEFYTNHYLNEIFEGDIKERLSSWQTKESESETYKTPFKRLKGLGGDYFSLLKELGKKTPVKEKIKSQREFMKTFLDSLGYEIKIEQKELEGLCIPLLSSVDKSDGSAYLWIVEGFCEESCDVLKSSIDKEQLDALAEVDEDMNFDEVITSHIFTLSEPPRWVMLVSAYQIVLIERAKYSQKRFLRFDIKDIMERKEDSVLKALSVLLHKESIASKDGLSLLDSLDENSHKHAFGVTEDLKYSLRSAVELLGNEAIYYYTGQNPDFINQDNLDEELTRESLRYMYRLLFLFYIESRPELGFIPSKSTAFIKGYSLENLRDLELMPLLTDSDKNGYFFDESVSLIFDMIYNGRVAPRANLTGKELFSISPLRSHLFDPSFTPMLNGVKVRNFIWQQIIQSLSLSRPKKGKGRGRISYANLGINQLGAVYEALLSYKGFIAKEELFEVKKAGSNPTELENAYFVTEAQLGEYTEDERVFDGQELRRYQKGSFIYRLAGRDREKSASYYTPEVLTKSLVKYALKELLEIDEDGTIGKSADEILNLTVCEPAMGSAAFLNEAINQLSEAYLHQKQRELNEKISHDKYTEEIQKVKMHIADNNVYGVDLNPTAVELAEISLWLNALSGAFVPWFGFQLENGNSLIGARREVYEIHQLTATKKDLLWYEDAPKRLSPRSLWLAKKHNIIGTNSIVKGRPSFYEFDKGYQAKLDINGKEESKSAGRKKDTQVYHFLLGDEAMASYTNTVVKSLKKEQIEKINKWRKEFIKPHSDAEVKKLLSLSLAIDKLWQEHTRHINDMKKKTTDTLYVWGQKKQDKQQTNIEYKDTVFMQEKLSSEVKSSSPYMRLKMVMDYWCSLWFWSIDEADKLPTRAEFLEDISLLVEKRADIMMDFDKKLFSDTMDEEILQTQLDELGFIDVSELIAKSKRLQVVREISKKQKFLHWELEFADVFAKKGGFDLILGNPPWLKIEWNESGIMGEVNPLFDIREFSASQLNKLREVTFQNFPKLLNEYIDEYKNAISTQNFLNAYSNYPLLKGVQTNLYKCFLPIGWRILNGKGISGFLHPEGVYDDPKGGMLRQEMYKKLKYHFQYKNEMLLFQEVSHTRKYSVNIFNNQNTEMGFYNIANLYLPQTIDLCLEYTSIGQVGGIKDDNNNWNTQGHKDRIVEIKSTELRIFNDLYEQGKANYLESRLPVLHSIQLINVLKKLAQYERKVYDIQNEFYATVLFDESSAQKKNVIVKNTSFADKSSDVILSAPHFYVSNPFYKTPRQVYNKSSDYDNIDLLVIPDNYLPRTIYLPVRDNFENMIPSVNLKNNQKFTQYYKLSSNKMVDTGVERTYQVSILPKKFTHISGVRSFVTEDTNILMQIATFGISLIADFFVKSTGTSNFGNTHFYLFPLIKFQIKSINRLLTLTCITNHYTELYEEQYRKEFTSDSWSKKDDPRLNQNFFKELTSNWQRNVALRTDYERRQALVEIDVLVAQELKLTLEELKTIYRIQFPVLKQNENETFYDINGRIVFTVSKGLTGVGLPKKADKKATSYKIVINGETVEEKPLGWEDIKDITEGEIHRTIMDDTMPNGPIERTIVYKAPFAKCDREKDYEVAWSEFERRGVS